jgi:hypothetical protein
MFCFVPELLADKCGTFMGTSFHDKMKSIQKGEKILRPTSSYSVLSSNKHFRINYEMMGTGAVDSTDKDSNGIPDYIETCGEAFEYAYTIQVDSMGFPPPPNNGENGAEPYDIFIIELSNSGIYGQTSSAGIELPGSSGNYMYVQSYIEIDNNYSKIDRKLDGSQSFQTFGLEALKITAAHEFHHAIQFANYGIDVQAFDRTLYEMYSTWLEMYLYPEIKDYQNYVSNYFLSPKEYRFGQRNNYESGYANALFFEYMYDLGGIKPMIDMWDAIGSRVTAYEALELVLSKHSMPLDEIWCGFIERVYHTGSKAIGKTPNNLFKDALELPELKSVKGEANPNALLTDNISPFEISLTSCSLENPNGLKDTAQILLSPVKRNAFNGRSEPSPILCSITIDQNSNNKPIGFSNYYVNINTNFFSSCSSIVLTQGRLFIENHKVYPNPYILHKHSSINLPIPAPARLGEEVQVKIFTSSGMPVYSGITPIIADFDNASVNGANIMVARFNNLDFLEPGIYIFTVFSELGNISGKFAVKR